jgi:hypothetical protein
MVCAVVALLAGIERPRNKRINPYNTGDSCSMESASTMFRVSFDDQNFQPFAEFGHEIQQSVMPLVTQAGTVLNHVGTGFTIDSGGLMMTAGHVIEYALSHRTRTRDTDGFNLYALYVSSRRHGLNNEYFLGGLWPISHVWWQRQVDIGFCWLQRPEYGPDHKEGQLQTPGAMLSFRVPQVGEEIVGCGYHGTTRDITAEQVEGGYRLDYAHKTAFTIGRVVQVFPRSRDTGMLRFPCFQTDARFEPGMSGGPIFDGKGGVCGVICSSMPPTNEDPRYISHGSLLWPALGTELHVCLDGTGIAKPVLFHDYVATRGLCLDGTLRTVSIETVGTVRQVTLNPQ